MIRKLVFLSALALAATQPLAAASLPPAPSPAVDAATSPRDGFDSDSCSFSVRFHGEVSPYRVLGVFVRPGERIAMRVETGDAGPYVALSEAGALASAGERGWEWEAPPAPGLHRVAVLHAPSGETMVFHAFVVVPHEDVRGGVLNGYRIGEYPQPAANDFSWSNQFSPSYAAPIGYIEVTPENESTLVSPHFRLKQFVCKQPGAYPRYVVLRERLLLKLERLLALVNESGVPAQSFHIMSGYRTPFYNAAIGNVKRSRHQWGDAADIFIDENGDGVMDDVNRDRRIDRRDSDWLRVLVERLHETPGGEQLAGGIGLYASNAEHGPFVHVDARGRQARW
jgi:hypothetical protein